MLRWLRDLGRDVPDRGRIASLVIAYGATADLTTDRLGKSILEAEISHLMRHPDADRTTLHALVDSQLHLPPLSALYDLLGMYRFYFCSQYALKVIKLLIIVVYGIEKVKS